MNSRQNINEDEARVVEKHLPLVSNRCRHKQARKRAGEAFVRRFVRVIVLAVVGVVVLDGVAFAATITQPTGNPFVVPGDANGNPLPFTIVATGYTAGSQVFVEQCDGVLPTAPGWSPTIDCDNGTSPAAAIASANGTATFSANDLNHAFHPFKNDSPSGQFNCLSPNDPSPNNGLTDYRNCRVRVSSNNAAVTSDQAFLLIQLPDPPTTTCTSFVGTADLSQAIPVTTGTVSGCNSNGDGELTAVLDLTGGVVPANIFWATAQAASGGTVQVINIDFSGNGCPAGDIAATLDVEIGGGPYAGNGGVNNVCADLSLFPTVTFTNNGDFHI
jgi:hypothetical protein